MEIIYLRQMKTRLGILIICEILWDCLLRWQMTSLTHLIGKVAILHQTYLKAQKFAAVVQEGNTILCHINIRQVVIPTIGQEAEDAHFATQLMSITTIGAIIVTPTASKDNSIQ